MLSPFIQRTTLLKSPTCRTYHIGVIGSGQMGAGIAQVSAQYGHTVKLMDLSEKFIKRGISSIEFSLSRIIAKKYEKDPQAGEKFKKDVMGRISTTTSLRGSIDQNTDLVVEAIAEDLSEKRKIFKELDSFADSKTIFTSNTSSITIMDIAKVTKRTDRFAGLHFFNPVPMMKLVEIVNTQVTSVTTHQFLLDFCKSIQKSSITCKDTPGFVVNRLLVPYIVEAIRLCESGTATREDIDTGMKLGAGYPMGPLELADYVGLDTLKFILEGWHIIQPNAEAFKPSPLLNQLVEEGKLGKKTGEGFYKYNS